MDSVGFTVAAGVVTVPDDPDFFLVSDFVFSLVSDFTVSFLSVFVADSFLSVLEFFFVSDFLSDFVSDLASVSDKSSSFAFVVSSGAVSSDISPDTSSLVTASIATVPFFSVLSGTLTSSSTVLPSDFATVVFPSLITIRSWSAMSVAVPLPTTVTSFSTSIVGWSSTVYALSISVSSFVASFSGSGSRFSCSSTTDSVDASSTVRYSASFSAFTVT